MKSNLLSIFRRNIISRKDLLFIRIAKKNPLEDYSVPGWSPNSVIIENLFLDDPKAILKELKKRHYIVRFSEEQLSEALKTNTLDKLPQLYVDGVCCFQAESIKDWAETYGDDLYRMGYINKDGTLVDDTLKVWLVEGIPIPDIEDVEGIYVKPTKVKDITKEAIEILKGIYSKGV